MSRTVVSILVLCLALLAASAEVRAQATTGTVDGVVSGPDGSVLPGVMVVANSPTMIQRDVTVYTDRTGHYRLPFLLSGTYEITFSLQGFNSFTQSDVIVRVSQTTEQNAVLELSSVTETVTVTAEAPIIDARAARLAFTYTEDLAQNIPVQRTVNKLFETIPGVETNNSYGNVDQPGLIDLQNVLGAGERANDYVLDGGNVADPATQWNQQMLMPYDIVEEVQVVKSAKPAEIPYQGGLFNMITSSGSNDLHGNIGGFFTDKALQSSNAEGLRDEFDVASTNEIVKGYEVTASLGGRIIRDKLWWFASARQNESTNRVWGFDHDIDNSITGLSGKLTYQANQDHRITFNATGWSQHVSHFFFGFAPSLALDEWAAADRPLDGWLYGGRWSGVLNENVLAEAGMSYAIQGYDQDMQPGADQVSVVDLATGWRSRNLGDGSRIVNNKTIDLNGSLSWFIPDAAGRHDMKLGFQYLPTHVEQTFDDYMDHRLHTLFGNKFAVRFVSTASTAIWDNDTTSLYAQDAWSIGNRLTLNFGLRFANRSVVAPETQSGGGVFSGTSVADRFPELNLTTNEALDLVDENYVEPRFATTLALDEPGRTILRAGASQYHHIITAFDLFVATPAFPHNFVTLWFDRNNDDAFQPGEDGPLLFSFGGAINSVDPDLKPAYTNEFVLGVSHELSGTTQVSANFIYREDKDLFNTVDIGVPFDSYTPVEALDPGPDGIPGTGDDAMLTVFAQDPATIGQNAYQITNPVGDDRTYKGLEITASRRLADNWQAVASVVISQLEVIKTTGSNEIAGVYDSPNDLINAQGLDPNNPPFQMKLQGTYMFDFGLSLSGFYRLAAGFPYTRELVVAGLPQGPINVFAEPRGESRSDTSNVLDLRLEQEFNLSAVGGSRIGLIFDVFNLFNSAAIVDYGRITGVDYDNPRAVQKPRLIRLGARFTW